jgi:hypothetical protein
MVVQQLLNIQCTTATQYNSAHALCQEFFALIPKIFQTQLAISFRSGQIPPSHGRRNDVIEKQLRPEW